MKPTRILTASARNKIEIYRLNRFILSHMRSMRSNPHIPPESKAKSKFITYYKPKLISQTCLRHFIPLTFKPSDSCHLVIASAKLQPEMILEDVESDNEGQQKHEDQPKASTSALSVSLAPPLPTSQRQQEATQETQSNLMLLRSVQSQKVTDVTATLEPSQSSTKISQEDAETQTGRWTPFIESIKREAEGVALATMEER